jgi:hypothetical protein
MKKQRGTSEDNSDKQRGFQLYRRSASRGTDFISFHLNFLIVLTKCYNHFLAVAHNKLPGSAGVNRIKVIPNAVTQGFIDID